MLQGQISQQTCRRNRSQIPQTISLLVADSPLQRCPKRSLKIFSVALSGEWLICLSNCSQDSLLPSLAWIRTRRSLAGGISAWRRDAAPPPAPHAVRTICPVAANSFDAASLQQPPRAHLVHRLTPGVVRDARPTERMALQFSLAKVGLKTLRTGKSRLDNSTVS